MKIYKLEINCNKYSIKEDDFIFYINYNDVSIYYDHDEAVSESIALNTIVDYYSKYVN